MVVPRTRPGAPTDVAGTQQKLEAAAAAADFRKIADSDGDGRITPSEYRDARTFILARY